MESQYLQNRRAIMLGIKEPPQKEKAKPIPKRSYKMKKIIPELKKKYKAFLATHEACELKMNGCTQKAEVIHHTKGRIGELLMNEKYWMASCMFCNGAVESNDKQAREKGLKLSKHTK